MFEVTNVNYINFNERDIEVPAFFNFLKTRSPISSLLDVGGCYSFYAYASGVREILGVSKYDAIDVLPCEKTKEIVDNYFLGNVREVDLAKYDVVSCISTIEHSGITSYKEVDYQAEQRAVFERLCDLANKHIYVTFPFGASGLYPNEYSNITHDLLNDFRETASRFGFKVDTRHYHNEFPQGKLLWSDISEEEASKLPIVKERGVQNVCLLSGSKE